MQFDQNVEDCTDSTVKVRQKKRGASMHWHLKVLNQYCRWHEMVLLVWCSEVSSSVCIWDSHTIVNSPDPPIYHWLVKMLLDNLGAFKSGYRFEIFCSYLRRSNQPTKVYIFFLSSQEPGLCHEWDNNDSSRAAAVSPKWTESQPPW